MNVTIMIETQLFENKNWQDPSKPKRWRTTTHGAAWFKVEVHSYDLMYSETEKILTEMVAAKSSDIWKYEYLQHHEILGKVETLSSDEFAKINGRQQLEASMVKLDGESDDLGTDIAIDMGR